MKDNTSYNGWVNRETWLVNLHIANDYDMYSMWRGYAILARKKGDGIDSTRWLADRLRDHFVELSPLPGATLYSDLLGTALMHVHWHDIAADLLVE